MITWWTIISGSTGPIFAIFSLKESVFGADDQSRPLSDISRDVPWQPILWKNGKLPSFFIQAFQNRMGYHYLNVRINSENDASIPCKIIVNFCPVTLELTEPMDGDWYENEREYHYLHVYVHINSSDDQATSDINLVGFWSEPPVQANQCVQQASYSTWAFGFVYLRSPGYVSLLLAKRGHCGAEWALCKALSRISSLLTYLLALL